MKIFRSKTDELMHKEEKNHLYNATAFDSYCSAGIGRIAKSKRL
jgi:hypothetical protein